MKNKLNRKSHRKALRERFQRDFQLKRRCRGCLAKTKELLPFKKDKNSYWLCDSCLIKAFNLRLRKVNFSIRKLGSTHLKGIIYMPKRLLHRVSASQSPQLTSIEAMTCSPNRTAGMGGTLDNRVKVAIKEATIEN